MSARGIVLLASVASIASALQSPPLSKCEASNTTYYRDACAAANALQQNFYRPNDGIFPKYNTTAFWRNGEALR